MSMTAALARAKPQTGKRENKKGACTMSHRSLYLAAYDVAGAGRLRAALELVKGYSTGGQKSVHECFLSEAERARLLRAVVQTLSEADDSFLLLRLDPRSSVQTLGKGIVPMDSPYFYVA
jgi:CRISPR-associated protein Cas2